MTRHGKVTVFPLQAFEDIIKDPSQYNFTKKMLQTKVKRSVEGSRFRFVTHQDQLTIDERRFASDNSIKFVYDQNPPDYEYDPLRRKTDFLKRR